MEVKKYLPLCLVWKTWMFVINILTCYQYEITISPMIMKTATNTGKNKNQKFEKKVSEPFKP